MIRAIKKRKAGLAKAAGILGGAYCLHSYISDKLADVKRTLDDQRAASDHLKQRFTKNQEDILYTVMALLPTLSDQVLRQMDVDSLTRQLKSISTRTSPPSLASSIEFVRDQDGSSDIASSSVVSASESVPASTNELSTSGLQSWVDASNAPHSHPQIILPQMNADSGPESISSSSVDAHPSQLQSSPSGSKLSELSITSSVIPSKSKAELWNELKLLTLTRTLTTIYSTSIFTLLTTIQLTLLARIKYVAAVKQAERDERLQERLQAQLTLSNLLWQTSQGLESLFNSDSLPDEEFDPLLELSDEVEKKFLTMSWWILHVGWKDIGERVQKAVEEVFEGVSLKTRLAAIDVHRLVHDVRRRVEHEITFEGREKSTDLFSTLLPPTRETMQLVLSQSGFISSNSYDHLEPSSSLLLASSGMSIPPTEDEHPLFDQLFSETRQWITSANFTIVLEACLDRASELFFEGLERSLFTGHDASSLAPGELQRIRLAALLPGLARWSELALTGLPNELVENILDVPQVSIFQAIIWGKIDEAH